ncbi:MAG: dynamin family protein, partial [Gammaproteobacteria bacterium]|nr:dynamin family protein [Gammaproteobacteria bacterium]
SFINRFLLQQAILPAIPTPTTTRPTVIRYGASLQATLHFLPKEGELIEQCEVIKDQVAERLRQTVQVGGNEVERVNYVELEAPVDALKSGVEIVDSPGLNDPDLPRMQITLDFLPKADAILLFLSAQQLFTRNQNEFLQHHILKRRDLNRLFILVNYWDQVDSSERSDVLAHLRQELQKLLSKQDDLSGYLNQIKILPVSAKTGENGDEVQAEIWNYLAKSKAEEVLSLGNHRFNQYVDSYLLRLASQIELVLQDRSERDKQRLRLEQEAKHYQQQRDQLLIELKKILAPEFTEYRHALVNLFDQTEIKMVQRINELGKLHGDDVEQLNRSLVRNLSALQQAHQRQLQMAGEHFLQRLRFEVERQKGRLNLPQRLDVELNEYFLDWNKALTSDAIPGVDVLSKASATLGIAGLLVGAGTFWAGLAAPAVAVNSGLLATIGGWFTTSTTVVVATSFATFGIPALVVGVGGILGFFYGKQQKKEKLAKLLVELIDNLSIDLQNAKGELERTLLAEQPKRIDLICSSVDHEVTQIYQNKIDELQRLSGITDNGEALKQLKRQLECLKLEVNF